MDTKERSGFNRQGANAFKPRVQWWGLLPVALGAWWILDYYRIVDFDWGLRGPP